MAGEFISPGVTIEIDTDADKAQRAIDALADSVENANSFTDEYKSTLSDLQRELDGVTSSQEQTTEEIDKGGESANKSAISFRSLAAALGTVTAASLGLAKASDRVTTLERNTGRAAVTFDQTTEGVYSYVKSLADARDSQEEVGDTINYLSRAGVDWGDELSEIYRATDDIGDATGKTSTQVAQTIIPTLRAAGLEVKDITEYVDALAFAVNTTTFDMENWSYISRVFGDVFEKGNVSMMDSIALMAMFESKGMNVRIMRRDLNALVEEASKQTESLTKAEKELLDIQDKLNDATKSGSDITRMYRYDMKMAGGDIAKRRDLTLAYLRTQEEKKGNIEELQTLERQKKEEVETLKSAPSKDLETLIKEKYPEFADWQAKFEGGEVKGAADKYAKPENVFTGEEQAKFFADQTAQSIGSLISESASADLWKLSAISGTITAMATVLSLVKDYSLITSINTGISAGGALGGTAGATSVAGTAASTAAGLAVPAVALVAGIAATSFAAQKAEEVTINAGKWQGYEEKQKFFKSGGTQEEWQDYQNKESERSAKLTAMGENAPTAETAQTPEELALLTPIPLPKPRNPLIWHDAVYDMEGNLISDGYLTDVNGKTVVPETIAPSGKEPATGEPEAFVSSGKGSVTGEPEPAVAEPPSYNAAMASAGISQETYNKYKKYLPDDPAEYASNNQQQNGLQITINGGVNLSKDYDFQRFMKDMERYYATRRVQSGVRSSR